MIIAGQAISQWTLYCSLSVFSVISLCLFLAIHHIIRHGKHQYTTEQPHSWTQPSNMEKAQLTSQSPPPATACDVLEPLSSNGAFPTSGAVAARAHQQMASAGNTSNSNANSPPAQTSSPSQAGSDATKTVQKRSETIQQLHEEDADGVRTWRRLIVEYK